MNKIDWTVRIIAAPPGEAPLWVRQKWVGLDLPVTRYAGHGRFPGLHVLSMPRVDYLREAGVNKSFWCRSVWSLAGICRIVTGETDANRRRQVGARIDQYNDGLQQEVTGADGVRFSWSEGVSVTHALTP